MDGAPASTRFQWLGEVPSVMPDVPVNAIFLILFLMVGGAHGFLYVKNRSQGRMFIINALVTAFCLTRVLATSLRMAWACNVQIISLGIAATVFLYVGIVILYVANMAFAQRLLRAQHPHFGWSKSVSIAFQVESVITTAVLIILVSSVIAGHFTHTASSTTSTLQLQKFGATMLALVATLPLLIATSSSLARRHPHIKMTKTIDKFGAGSMHGKLAIIVISALLLCISAWFRAGALLAEPSPVNSPQPGYLSKACFYVFILTFEIAVPILWLFTRVDLRFFIPDGAKGPFSYAGGFVFAGEVGNEKSRISIARSSQSQQEPSSLTVVGSRPASFAGARPSSTGGPISPASRRSSWAESLTSQTTRERRAERDAEKQMQLEKRISWGGVSREDVRDTTDESGKVLRYQPFAESWTGGDSAADVGIEGGPDKEMGFDPESGRWAVRPISAAGRPESRRDEAG